MPLQSGPRLLHVRVFQAFRFIGRLSIMVATMLSARLAPAALIFYDTFTVPNNSSLIGRLAAPNDLPATSYQGNGNVSTVGGPTGGSPYEADIQGNEARIGADAGVAMNLNISTPQQFQLSIDFNISTDTGTQANDPHRGAGLGFFSSVANAGGGSSHGFNNFTGLTVDNVGSVRLIVAGADSGIFTTIGGFNSALTHTLSFVVDTNNGLGTISSISLDGATLSLTAPVNTFTIGRATYAGFYNSSVNATDVANFDNFFVATIPEFATAPVVPCFTLLICSVAVTQRRLRRHSSLGVTKSLPGPTLAPAMLFR